MTTDLLSIERLSLHARGGAPLVDNVSFTARSGEVTALLGESGSGKTMIARTVMGLLPQGVNVTGGAVRFDGDDLLRLSPQRLRALRGPGLGMVFQEPMVSLNPALKIGRQLAEGLALHADLSPREIHERCVALLTRIGLRDPEACLRAHPHEFSGGMRQRIMLASVMLLRPRLLIADEPTTALDNLTQREVLDLMVELAAETGTAVLLITHNLGLVAKYAQRAVVLRRGVLVEQGTTDRVLRQPQQDYTRSLVAALPRRGPPRPAAAERAPVLAVDDLSVVYRSRGETVTAVDTVSFALQPGETIGLVGASGSGKTTLGRAAIGLAPVAGGVVRFRGNDVRALDAAGRHDYRRACQLIFQDPFSSLNPRERVAEIVGEPLRHEPGLAPKERAQRVAQMLGEVGLAGLAERRPHELSGGQRQRVAIARAIIRRPPVVVADEPVSALDMTIQKQVLDLLRRLQQSYGFSCLFISHDLGAVEQVADRVLVMQAGRIVEQGGCAAVMDEPQHPYTRALLEATPTLDAAALAAGAKP